MTSRRRGRGTVLRTGLTMAAVSMATALVTATATPAQALGDGGHDLGRMGPLHPRTTVVDPATGPDFEMPFLCGQKWTGTTRPSHSPSPWTIDWNTTNDLGKPALASAPGIVITAKSLTGSYGRYVVIDHGNGWTTLYAHLNAIVATVGTVVDQGDLIGYVGGSGNVTGPHLHFEERLNGAYFHPYLHRTLYTFGTTPASPNCTDRPLVGDWDGDGRTDIGIFRTTPTGDIAYTKPASGPTYYPWGSTGDVPVTGDFDGNGTTQVGVRKLGSSSWVLRGGNAHAVTVAGIGLPSDIPVTGDWDGNRRTDLGYYRPSTHTFYLRSIRGVYTAVPWGAAGDQPVTGDWNGDGITDLGTFNPATRTWTLRVPNGTAYDTKTVVYGGTVGDNIPITGDWNGDKITDLGVWRPSSARFYERTVDSVSGRPISTMLAWGRSRG